jgi:hypothetical protein
MDDATFSEAKSSEAKSRAKDVGSMYRASVAAALVLIGACAGAQAETGPCKSDQFNGLTCGAGPGAARVIQGTTSPDKNMAFAWRVPGKAPTEEPYTDQVESVLIWLGDGKALAIAPGDYWDTGTGHANRFDFHAIWSPNSRLVIELLDFRWSTETLRLYALGEHRRPLLALDLKPIMELAVRKQLRKTVKNEASYAFEIQGDNSGEPVRLTIDNTGLIKARIEMQVPKEEDPEIYVDVVFQVRERDGALEARPLSIRKSNDKN